MHEAITNHKNKRQLLTHSGDSQAGAGKNTHGTLTFCRILF